MVQLLTRPGIRWPTVAAVAVLLMAAFAPMAGASLLERVTVHGFEVRQSRGSKLRQHVTADMSQVAPDDVRSVIADNPICRVVLDSDEPTVEVTSARLRYYFRGPDRTPGEDEADPPLPVELIRQWNEELLNAEGMPRLPNPSRGDFLFSSPPDGEWVHVDLGERGELFARFLLWSEEYQRFVALGGFNQRTINERGDRIITRGVVFTADEQFQSISYPIVGDETVEIEIE
jgi:hypothetical protein